MRWALRISLLVAGFAISADAHAGTATVSWDNPTQREDGSDLPLSELASTRISWGYCNLDGSFGTKVGEMLVPAPTNVAEVQTLAAGVSWCFKASAIDTEGLESADSNIASKYIKKSRPRPPRLKSIL